MNEPRRLRDDPNAPAELRALVRSARPSERMTAAELRRGAQRVGAATTLAASWLLWVKGPAFAALIGAASGVVFATGVPLLFDQTPPPAPAPLAIASSTASLPAEPAATPERAVAPRAAEPAPVVRRSAAPKKAAVEESTTPRDDAAKSPAGDTLAEEAHLVEQARQALGSDPARALALLERHQRLYAQGKLGMERELLMVDALARVGRKSEAKARAEALLRLPHKGIYEARLARLLSTLGP